MKKNLTRALLTFLAILIAGAIFFAANPAESIYQIARLVGQPNTLAEKSDNMEDARWFDDYFTIDAIDDMTFVISEPRYWQYNNSYLVIGSERAILFDSGPGIRDIKPVIRSLTNLPITTIPSHFHDDHVAFVGGFESVALPDIPSIRSRIDSEGHFTIGGREHLGEAEDIQLPPRFKVDEWLTLGAEINLGNRLLKIISAPGHTQESIILYDAQRLQAFVGDFIYTGALLAILPGGNSTQYAKSSAELAGLISQTTTLLPGHGPWKNPKLTFTDLKDLTSSLHQVKLGLANTSGVFPRKVQINERMELWLPFVWND